MQNKTNIVSLETKLSLFFDHIIKDNNNVIQDPYLRAMTSIFCGQTAAGIMPFALDDESTAKAIANLKDNAQNGYSVKNLPDTENRGYGISSNMKMVVEGLHGEFAALSGNALLLQMANRREILALPPEIDFKGTMIMVRIPAQVPDSFNLYDYMS